MEELARAMGMTNEQIADFAAFNKAVDELKEKEGLSENEALDRVSATWVPSWT